jgi:hypothetical protein
MVKSMSFPQTWKPYLGVLVDWDRSGDRSTMGGEFHLGIYRDLMNPIIGALGFAGEGYLRAVNNEVDGGLRLMGGIPVLFFYAGAEYSFRDENTAFLISFVFPAKRGGIFGRGSTVRFDILPKRGPTYSLGINFPIGQPYIGRTRPRKTFVELPKHAKQKGSDYKPTPELQEVLVEVRQSADWINRYTTPFFDQERDKDEEGLRPFYLKLARFKRHFHLKDENFPAGRSFEAEINFYHKQLDRAFLLASGKIVAGTDGDGPLFFQIGNTPIYPQNGDGSFNPQDKKRTVPISDKAREILLDEVILPYNQALGQRKKPDSLLGLGAAAERKFRTWVFSSPDIPAAYRERVVYVFNSLLQYMEENRLGSLGYWEDNRFVWIPFHYALRLEDHDTQAEIDEILEKATGEKFTEGNEVHYIINEQFQWELARMILETEDYHVLWIHDYAGVGIGGKPDSVSFRMTTRVYLRALIERIKAYDDTKKLPVYMIFLDQHYYEINKAKHWLELLENPLGHKIKLPRGYEDWEQEIREVQEQLRSAVADSVLLQSDIRKYGHKWLKNKVKVQINITNPADLSFRSPTLINYLPFMPDNLLRDHRKISFRDVTELDPSKGEAIFTGTGVGENYATATWEDRALLTRGPSLVGLKDAARELLLSQSFKEQDIPPPLQPLQKPNDYQEMVQDLVDRGWTGRGIQVHNQTGFGSKPNNLVKAVLYNLMPKGSHLYIPDSLWNSPLWAGMVAGAALRGCKVFVVSPSSANAPSSAAMTISRTNEIFTRLVVVQQEMKDEIEAVGGMLKVGIYDLDIDISDRLGAVTLIQRHFQQHSWLREIFPFSPGVYELIQEMRDYLEQQGFQAAHLAEDQVKRRPKLHMKSQFFASQESIETLIPLEVWKAIVRDYVVAKEKTRISENYVDAKKLRAALSDNSLRLTEEWLEKHPVDLAPSLILYLTVGSHNQDYRSKVMDAEVTYVVSYMNSLIAYLDFFTILGISTWIEDIEQLEKLLPPVYGLMYKLGRYIKLAI